MKLEILQLSRKLYEIEVPALDLVNGAEIFIGRSEDCHVVLDDHQVSRQHAALIYHEGSLLLKKLSEHGSLSVNGNEVREATLGEGDKFSITDFSVVVRELPRQEPDSAVGAQPESPEEPSETRVFDESMLADENASEPPIETSEEATAILDSLEDTDSDEIDDIEEDEPEVETGFSPESEDLLDSVEESPMEPEGESAFDTPSDVEEGFGGDEGFGDGEIDGFGEEEGFGDEGFGDAGGESTQVFQSFASYFLEIDGERAPFDKYRIEDREIFIGRDSEKCQITLNDPEVSSVHAVIKKTLINCFIEDLNSSNGTVFNGERVNKAELSNNDNFQIGSTIFTVKIVSDLLESEKDTLMPVEDGQEVEVQEVVEEEVDYDDLVPEGDEYSMEEVKEQSVIKRIWSNPKKRMIVVGVFLLFVFLWLSEEETAPKQAKDKSKAEKEQKVAEKAEGQQEKKELPADVIAKLEENYALALAKYEAGEYYESKEYLEVIRGIDPNFKDTETLHQLVQQGHEEILRLKAEEEAEKERKKRQLIIQGLLEKVKEAVDKREVAVSENLFGQILEIDPENMDVPQLKLELEAYKDEQRRKKEDAARKKALRQGMVDALQPGKTLFLKEDWYRAIDRLEKFTRKQGMDEDLIEEATEMLMKARKNLSNQVNPLLGRARSFKEGQDLKRAYETYGEVLKYDPSNEEAITERDKIHESLRTRSMKIYREALISESLSLFDEAREKFEEVQQVSPVNSEYYIKASDRLKNYLE